MTAWLRTVRLAVALVVATGAASAQETAFDFGMLSAPQVMPELQFGDSSGKRLSLADFRGKYVLLNVWATWCPPCRQELPTLDRLQEELGGSGFQVIALSTDTGRLGFVKRLYRQLGLPETGIFIDETGSAMRDLRVFALPTTVLIDGEGNEVGRKIGPAVWDSLEAVAFFRASIAGAGTGTDLPLQ